MPDTPFERAPPDAHRLRGLRKDTPRAADRRGRAGRFSRRGVVRGLGSSSRGGTRGTSCGVRGRRREEPGTELLETLRRSLREKRALLLLDNCEHHLNPCAEIALGLLQGCPHVTILATSREALRIPGEHTFRVPPLSVPDADAALSVQSSHDSNRFASFRIARPAPRRTFSSRIGISARSPRSAAGWMGSRLQSSWRCPGSREFAQEDPLAKLDTRFRLLTNESPGVPARHQTLRAAIQWSYEHLTPEEQGLFVALSVFAGGWTFESAARVSRLRPG